MMMFIPVDEPVQATYVFEMPPAWGPDEKPSGAVNGSWYGRHISESAKITIIPFWNKDNLKLEDIAKLIKKQYFNDGECSLDDFHKDTSFIPSLSVVSEVYYYENCSPGRSNLFVICEISGQQIVIFNLSCSGERFEDLGRYFEDIDRIMRRFKWELK
jgi:hypothetical protein